MRRWNSILTFCFLFSNQAVADGYYWTPSRPIQPRPVNQTKTVNKPIAKAPTTMVRATLPRPVPVRSEEIFNPALTGSLESRPAYNLDTQKAYGQVFAELGYRFSPTFFVGYQQRIQHSLRDSLANNSDFMLDDGFVHVLANKLWTASKYPTRLEYEGRIYLPTNEVARDAGFQFALRNYFTFRREITPGFSMLFTEIPIIYAYNKAGSGNAANPVFENRVYFGPEFVWGKDAVVWNSMISFGTTKYRAYLPTARHDDVWNASLWIYTEVDFKISDNVTLGAAYESGRFVNIDLTDDPTNKNEGTFSGVAEAILRLSF